MNQWLSLYHSILNMPPQGYDKRNNPADLQQIYDVLFPLLPYLLDRWQSELHSMQHQSPYLQYNRYKKYHYFGASQSTELPFPIFRFYMLRKFGGAALISNPY